MLPGTRRVSSRRCVGVALQLLTMDRALGAVSVVNMRATGNISGRRTVLVFLLLTVASEFVRSSVGTFSVVEGLSMYPTFRPNDVVQTKSPTARPERGDVVIVTDDRGDLAIKRIIGLPGEIVTLYRGFVYINGQRLAEPYLPNHTYTFKSNPKDELPEGWKLLDNQFFVMGDNRLQSHDSRNFGPVEGLDIQRVVSLPENAVKPRFCDIMLTKAGGGMP